MKKECSPPPPMETPTFGYLEQPGHSLTKTISSTPARPKWQRVYHPRSGGKHNHYIRPEEDDDGKLKPKEDDDGKPKTVKRKHQVEGDDDGEKPARKVPRTESNADA